MKFMIFVGAGFFFQQAGNYRLSVRDSGDVRLHFETSGHLKTFSENRTKPPSLDFLDKDSDNGSNSEHREPEAVSPSEPAGKPFKTISFMDKFSGKIKQNLRTNQDRITVRFARGEYPYSGKLKLPDAICFDWDGTLARDVTMSGAKGIEPFDPGWKQKADKFFQKCQVLQIKLFIVSWGTKAEKVKDILGQDLVKYFKAIPGEFNIQEDRKEDLPATWQKVKSSLHGVLMDGGEHRIWGEESRLSTSLTKENFVNQFWPVLPSKTGAKPVVMMVDDAGLASQSRMTHVSDNSLRFFEQNESEETMAMSYHFKPSKPIFEGTGVDILMKFLALPFHKPNKRGLIRWRIKEVSR